MCYFGNVYLFGYLNERDPVESDNVILVELTCGFIDNLFFLFSATRELRVLDLIDTEVMDDELDWISCFPKGELCLESLMFDCVECAINFEALEKLVARSPSLKRLRLNRHISIGQLHCLMARAPQLTDIGTGSFGPSEGVAAQGDAEADIVSAFTACRSLVCLSGFRDIIPECLPAIYPVCANLTFLNFSYANITAEQLKPIICNCHKLQTFWVRLLVDNVNEGFFFNVKNAARRNERTGYIFNLLFCFLLGP